MAITHRKGNYNDYDPSRMRPAEFGVTLANDPKAVDGKAVHIAFAAGEDKTLMTFEDAEKMIQVATEEATSQAQQYATNSANSAKESRSYAKGGTSSRTGEDTDNAMYYKNQAASAANSASSSASTATTKASQASTSASQASTSAQTATSKASQASASATAAATSATNASSSAAAASTSATAAADSAEDAQKMSYTAEAWAVGTKNGIDVGSGDPQYHNNAKYYAEQMEYFNLVATGDGTVTITLSLDIPTT